MRRSATHRSKLRRKDEPGASLFSFLAVLICTMGVLIVLLVVIARHARAQAAEEALAQTAQDKRHLAESREDVQWRIEQLRASLAATQSQLADARLELGHLEEHSQKLRGQLAELQETWRQLNAQTPRTNHQAAEQLQTLRTAIAEAERQLNDARREADERERSYAVVPYEGPNGTHRRPIYIECRDDRVILQPEGIVVDWPDLDGPTGPQNPLAAALRAAREYWLQRDELGGESTAEPYPLLLVRPSGIDAYYAAREAMESWGSDFGYELIDEDWSLAFPPSDAALAETLRQEIDRARQRQRRLIEAAPRHYQHYRAANGAAPQHTVSSSRGGIVPYGNVQQSDSARSGVRRKPSAGRPGDDSSDDDNPLRETTADGASDTPLQHGASESAAAETAEGMPSRPGLWRPSEASSPDSSESESASAQSSPHRPTNLTKTRGQDWALPEASPRSTPLARPIRIECHPDRLVVVAQPGRGSNNTVPLSPTTRAAIDTFVSAIWNHMESWGIAGERMYWKPILNVYIAPGAEDRFADLEALLRDSGLEVVRKP